MRLNEVKKNVFSIYFLDVTFVSSGMFVKRSLHNCMVILLSVLRHQGCDVESKLVYSPIAINRIHKERSSSAADIRLLRVMDFSKTTIL